MASDEDQNILAKEIKWWKGFEYALRKPNATLFNKMLKRPLTLNFLFVIIYPIHEFFMFSQHFLQSIYLPIALIH
jgi:hypothetical protein